ncbi:MAG: hypothetical protein KDD55_05920, partial [Bdellovibrionales bacterium]|nr:hypothetical protein [Bdellovibrionales bacterium]
HDLPNIHCLPYQPVDRLRESLNAADLHVVSMGKSYVGLVHPSKLYGILATTTPLLLLGPELCPIAGLIQRENLGMVVSHEDSLSSVNAIKYFMTMNKDEYFGYVQRVAEVSKRYDKELLARTLAREIL